MRTISIKPENVCSREMIIDIDESRFEDVFKSVVKAAKKAEPDFEVYK